jgi:hypothetical protein
MIGLLHDRWVGWVLSAALAVSFVLCVGSDLSFSITLERAGLALSETAGFLALGMSWILGHGLHGAAVVALPLFFLARSGRITDFDQDDSSR